MTAPGANVNTVHVPPPSLPRPPRPSSLAAGGRDVGDGSTKALLVAAARDLFLEAGPAHFSLREIARRVGISAPAIYRHFDGKEALLAAACTQGFAVFGSYLVRALGAPSPHARLRATGSEYLRFAVENPLDYRFIFMGVPEDARPPKPRSGPTSGGLTALPQDTTFRLLVDRVRECIDAEVLANGDPEETAVLIWAHVHGLVALRLSGHLSAVGDGHAFAAFYERSVDRLLEGLRP